jgi:FlaG/FlaF family flagellin (archaellin)
MTRPRSRRRGVSYLVTVVLMTLIAVALSTLLYAYFSGWIGERTSSTGPTGALSVDTASATVTDTSITFSLYIRNVGTGDVQITDAFLTLPNGTIIRVPDSTIGTTMNPPNPTIQPNNVAHITINVPKSEPSSGTYIGWWTIKAIGDDGSTLTVKVLVR